MRKEGGERGRWWEEEDEGRGWEVGGRRKGWAREVEIGRRKKVGEGTWKEGEGVGEGNGKWSMD